MNSLYSLATFELFVGGGGRLIEFGPVTLRMILFAICLATYAAMCAYRKQSLTVQELPFVLVVAYTIVHMLSFLVGLAKDGDLTEMTSELQQSFYWLAAPFFAWVLRDAEMVRRTATLAKIAGVVLAAAYLCILLLLASRVISFVALHAMLAKTGEFMSRGSFFFYKGFLYLGISIVFLVATRPRYWKTLSLIVLVALVLTLTRGFLLSTIIAVMLLLFVQGRRSMFWVGATCGAIAAVVLFIYLPSTDAHLVASRAISNGQRIEDARFIYEHATVATALLGEGYGSLINDRFNIENSYLWAFWKLGLVGLCFWLIPLGLCTYYFMKIRDRRNNALACAFFFATVLVYAQTATNPYLNNPIGLSFVLISIFALRTLAMTGMKEREQLSMPPQVAV
jgi:hypothetical protein